MRYAILVILLAITGCNYSHQKAASNSTNNADSIDGSEPISWTLIQNQVMPSCFHCHSGLTPPGLASLTDVRTHLDTVVDEILTDSMPPSGSGYQALNNCQKAIINQWALEKAPETSTTLVSQIKECGTTSTPPVKPPTPPTPPPVTEQVIDWTLINTKVIQACSNCHGSSYNTYANASKKIKTIVSVVTKNSMPPKSPLSACQKTLLQQWANSGTPQTTKIKVSDFPECKAMTTPTPTPPPPTSAAVIDWPLINSKVIQACSGCHGSTYNTYANASKKIKTIVSEVTANAMPPKSPLSACQKTLLKQWANSGTPQTTKIKVSDFPECKNFASMN